MHKVSDCAQEAGGIIEHIRREVKSIKFDVPIKYSNDKLNQVK